LIGSLKFQNRGSLAAIHPAILGRRLRATGAPAWDNAAVSDIHETDTADVVKEISAQIVWLI